MIRAVLVPAAALALALLPAAAGASDRSVGIGSFDRLRVEGPFRVTVATGSPRVTVSGERQAIDAVEVEANGTTLVVRARSGVWDGPDGQRSSANAEPVVVTLSTPSLVSAYVIGAAQVSVAQMRGQRIDLSLSGTGALSVARADADQVNATVIGSGGIAVAGHAMRARLLTNGPGTIDAGGLAADDLTVRLDGPGETKGQARFTAQVVSTGLGRVTVAGNAKCSVKALAGGPVSCGPTR